MQNSVETVKTLLSEAIGTAWTQEKRTPEIYKSILKEKKSPHPYFNSVNYAYFTTVPEMPDGTGLQYEDVKVGSVFSARAADFGLGTRFTRRALEDMAREPFGEFSTSRIVAAAKLGEAFKRAEKQKKDLIAAGLFISGTSATDAAGRKGAAWDGLSIFNDAHTILATDSILGGVTYDNLGAASALSQATLYTLIAAAETFPTLEGHVRPLPMKWKLVVGPALRGTAYTAVETLKVNKVTGSNNNDIPAAAQFDIDVVVNPFFGASSTVYAVLSDDHDLSYWDYKKANLEDEKDFETKGHKWSIDFSWLTFCQDPSGALLSAGA